MISRNKKYRIRVNDRFQCEVVFNIIKQLGCRPNHELDHYVEDRAIVFYFVDGYFGYSRNLDRTLRYEERGDYDDYIKMEWWEFYRAYHSMSVGSVVCD